MTAPAVSVIMPVYNGAAHLREAIDSILAQTMRDFELIVVDDASRDGSRDIVRAVSDARVRLVEQERNRGVAAALNRGIADACGRYLARMDADDASRPGRLERQVAFLEANPGCGIVGTWTEIWSGDRPTDRAHRHPTDSLTLKFESLFDTQFVHSSVMLRKEVIDRCGSYPETGFSPYPEDFALWSKIARHFGMANLPEQLLVYREVPGSESRSSPIAFQAHVSAICAANLATTVGAPAGDADCASLAEYIHGVNPAGVSLARIARWNALLTRAADAVSDANGAPRDLLRERAAIRSRGVVATYGRDVRRRILGVVARGVRVFRGASQQ